MLVSIVIPVYNRAEMVKETLESVSRQTHRPLHIILVDNNSTDNTYSVLQDFKEKKETTDFKVDVIEEKKSGVCAARNAGARLVKSEWLMFFDSDDTMDECLVAKYVEKIAECGGDVDVVTTDADFNENGKVSRVNFARSNFFENHIFHSNLSTQRYIMRRELFERAGGWNEAVQCWNDWELGVRVLLQNPRVVAVDDGVYVHVRVHNKSITGARYSQNPQRRENAITMAVSAVEHSDYKDKERIVKLLKMRRFVLAGLYLKEGKKDEARRYYNGSYDDIKDYKMLRCLAPIVYRYVSMGGRGIDRLLKMMVK
ncbi:MAG: glycosyltransferase family 2 protein [Bacteroidales bacterium]|nr:glycosyltransferase family 2 protein [Bacteroidales bacterium]